MTMHLWKIVAVLALLAALAESQGREPLTASGPIPEEEWVLAVQTGIRTWSTPPKSLNGVCGKFVLHAGTAMTFSAGQTMIDGGNIGIHPGTAITGTYEQKTGSVDLETTV
jgi:hypothetical protein